MNQHKQQLRNEMKEKLKEMSPDQRESSNHAIHKTLFNHPLWLQANTIGITISRKPEVDTAPIIEKAWELGKEVSVPKCFPKTKEMEFRSITSYDQLEVVYFGLKEPIPDRTESCSPLNVDLLIVPGLVFDKQGYRIGFGGGYYDRYLENYSNGTVALAYDFQVVDRVPKETFDQPVQEIITDAASYSF
ncbi:5-formyltetrahydrofolate cyclo-ligase [Pseudalkalibacillus caeni]|uniref:5-formyltetrahydrofolate cyclo-ligase n=1 Tax=Exobacillus caeni TaxID=2574798 RepID=A0A5R9EYD2_9BACL|nr:5-formyltetrahydrofolate cyclo-ligase [Pseudalkalibacillus caeni]TLS36312.1 5-formyltetrahydrofolate cyclo-ligase [Pseudalkalibacillus caeni]